MPKWNRRYAFRVAILFTLFSLTWILVSDRLLARLVPRPEDWLIWQTLKGSIFVAICLLLIIFLMLRARRNERTMLNSMQDNAQTVRLQSAALQAADHAIMISDNRGLIQWVNPAFTRLTGYTLSDVRGKNPRELLHSGAQAPAFYEEMWQTIIAGKTWRGQLTNRRKDGALYTEEQSITPVCDDEGRVTHFIAIKQDVSRRNAAQEALRESEARYRSVFENNHTAMFIVDPRDGAIVDANPAAANFYGWPRDQLRQMDVSDISTLSPGEVQAEMDKARNKERESFAFRHRLANGELRHVEVSSGPISFGDRTLLYSIVRDVTERQRVRAENKRAHAERERLLHTLQQQADRLRGIMSSVPEGVLLVQPDDVIAVANPPALDFLALLAGVQVGDKLSRLGDDPLDAILAACAEQTWHEIEYEERVFEIAAHPLEAGSASRGWVFVIRDITDARLVQRQLQRQERLAVVGQMAAGIAHDFNNILGVILLQSQLLELNKQLPKGVAERLAMIVAHAQRAADLTQQILDFSSHARLERRPLDLLATLQDEVSMLQRTLPENVHADLTFDSGDYTILADAARVQQVIMNLALNARDAMPQGGNLHFHLAPLRVDRRDGAPLPGMALGDWLRLTISDTGQGMAPQVLDHIFEPFFSTKAPGKGTGLGLSQVHGIVAQHEGHITVASEEGHGTTFTVYLPAHAAKGDILRSRTEQLPQGRGERLLLVEDEPSLRQAIAEILQLVNYNVIQAQDGHEALALLDDGSAGVSLILSDIVMPRLGGVELYKALRQRQWRGPIIFMTGHAPQVQQDQLPPDSPVLLKPISPARLAETVRQVLDA